MSCGLRQRLRAGFCRLDVVVVSEVIKQHELWAYPYNALRNQAVSRAETEVRPDLLQPDSSLAVTGARPARSCLCSWPLWRPLQGLLSVASVSAVSCKQVLLLLDADFVVSKGLHEKLSEEKHFRALVEDTVTHRAAIVLPAFETDAALSADAGGQTAFTAQQGAHTS